MPCQARLDDRNAEKRDVEMIATPKGKNTSPSIGDFTAQKQVELVTNTRRMNKDTSLGFRRQVHEMIENNIDSQLDACARWNSVR